MQGSFQNCQLIFLKTIEFFLTHTFLLYVISYLIVVTFTSVINRCGNKHNRLWGLRQARQGVKTEVRRRTREQAADGEDWPGPHPADCRVYRVSGNLGSQSAEGQLKEVLI